MTSHTQPSHGTATVTSNGAVSYLPYADYFGPDSYTYTMTNGYGRSFTGTVSVRLIRRSARIWIHGRSHHQHREWNLGNCSRHQCASRWCVDIQRFKSFCSLGLLSLETELIHEISFLFPPARVCHAGGDCPDGKLHAFHKHDCPHGNPTGVSSTIQVTGLSGWIDGVTLSLNISGGFNGDLYAYLSSGTGGFSVRNVNPQLALDTDARTALFSSFNSIAPNTHWTLFVADMAGGGESTVESWSITIQTIPEPSAVSLAILSAAAVLYRRRNR